MILGGKLPAFQERHAHVVTVLLVGLWDTVVRLVLFSLQSSASLSEPYVIALDP